MIINIVLCGKHGVCRLYTLLNTGAQASFLSQKIIIEEGFWADSAFMSAMAVDSHLITVYSQHAVNTEAINFSGELYSFKIDFIATDIKRYDTILEWLWIFEIDPDCCFKWHKWYYCKSNISHEIDIAEMFKLKRADALIYAVYLNSVSFI